MIRPLFARTALALVTVLMATPPVAAACRSEPDGAPRFVLDGDTARDRASGLVWRRCALGVTWTGSGCSGERRWLGLDAAQAAVKDLGPGWRLPDVKELYDLMDETCGRPLVDTTVFPDVGASEGEGEEEYWTTTDVELGGLWYFVDLAGGRVDGHSRGFSLAVRPVRAAE